MLDGPATFAVGPRPARAATCSAWRSGELSGSAYGGHSVVTLTFVAGYPPRRPGLLSQGDGGQRAVRVLWAAGQDARHRGGDALALGVHPDLGRALTAMKISRWS